MPCTQLSGLMLCLALLFAAATTAHANRFNNFTERFRNNPDQARVVSATLLGGEGTEWLVGGGFQPDGTVVIVGNALGPVLDVAGQTAKVIGGRDAARTPPAPQRQQARDGRGNPRTNREGQPIYQPFTWQHENATAFIVRLTPNLERVISVTRLPWTAAGATGGAVDSRGGIYITGIAHPDLGRMTRNQQTLRVEPFDSRLPNRNVYLAKFSPDGETLEWVRFVPGPSAAPQVSINGRDQITLQGADLRTFDTAGKVVAAVTIPGGIGERIAVNPIDHSFAYGHEHHWRTGREPWRCPILNLHRPNGELQYQLYNWPGPYVGLNNLRLVSDSAVRNVVYDSRGQLIITGWSDGGNSVFLREPMDVRRGAENMRGLGMSAWGAGVLSAAYIIRIDPETCRVVAGTSWFAYLQHQDRPNGININTLGFASDGSIAIGGGSAWGLIQTGNNLNTGDQPGGDYVAVLNHDLTSLRFSSVLNACGASELNNNDNWAFATGHTRGRHRLLVLSGAKEKDTSYNKDVPPPTLRAVQPRFGGGHLDGHVLLLDLN